MPATKKKKCPECRKRFGFESLEAHPFYPFCSERCKLLDLGAWLSEKYAFTKNLTADPEQIEEMLDGVEMNPQSDEEA